MTPTSPGKRRATPSAAEPSFEAQVGEWRAFALKRRGVTAADADELEGHLRDQAADLQQSGLSADEAFLVAVKRLGSQDEISREFARAHSSRLWKQLVLAGPPGDSDAPASAPRRREFWAVAIIAVAAALAIKVPALFGQDIARDPHLFYPRNLAAFVAGGVGAYFAWKRQVRARTVLGVSALAAIGIALVNAYPFELRGQTVYLAALHLGVVLWLLAGVLYAAGDWRSHARRMDVIRFTGEWFVYVNLLGLGGGVLIGLTLGAFGLFGVDTSGFVDEWLLPCGLIGASVVAAWLVEAKQGVIEAIVPVLSKVFTPLFALLLLALVVTIPLTWSRGPLDRDALVIVDLLLAVVLGLALYATSARDSADSAGVFDWLQLVLVAAALVVDGLVLANMIGRIADYGFTANRTVAVGENLLLLVNLAWTAWLGWRFVRGKRGVAALERWQTGYVPVYFAWAALVVVALPPLFHFA